MGFVKKYLSADGLLKIIKHGLRHEQFKQVKNSLYSWEDCIMSGLAIFGFKLPSLLQFEQKKSSEPLIRRNLRALYGVDKAPSDTTLRKRLDEISPQQLRRGFKQIFAYLKQAKALDKFRYLGGHYIISIDGTGQFCSKKVHCNHCCEKSHRDGSITYYHQMLGAVLIHPDHKEVIPLAPEPIIKGDGSTKNDCERNAAKRLLTALRQAHPRLNLLIVEDGLSSHFPHLSLIDSLSMNYIIGVKPGDHKYLFDYIKNEKPNVITIKEDDSTQHEFRCYKNVPINDSHHDYRVNVIEYCETKKSGKK